MYHDMYLIRTFELKMQANFVTRHKADKTIGSYHSYEGQEAIAVGVSACVRDDDYVFSTHRGHGHALAKGLKLEKPLLNCWEKRLAVLMIGAGLCICLMLR